MVTHESQPHMQETSFQDVDGDNREGRCSASRPRGGCPHPLSIGEEDKKGSDQLH